MDGVKESGNRIISIEEMCEVIRECAAKETIATLGPNASEDEIKEFQARVIFGVCASI